MKRKKVSSKWLSLSKEEEQMILKDHDKGVLRSNILRKYKITADQFVHVIRKALLK